MNQDAFESRLGQLQDGRLALILGLTKGVLHLLRRGNPLEISSPQGFEIDGYQVACVWIICEDDARSLQDRLDTMGGRVAKSIREETIQRLQDLANKELAEDNDARSDDH